MRHYQTEVLIIGGGATGTGILRDLAMRGFRAILVERRDLTQGTTGRYHGLLHSGCRYVVKDPQAARECIEENRILRRIMPQCLEDTGGFFVLTPWDDPEYAPIFLGGCNTAGIPVEDIQISQMLKEEPLLNPKIARCFRVPDGAADSFLAAELNVISARQHGATSLTYHQVNSLLLDQQGGRARVVGAACHDLVKDEEVRIVADMVINASGAWAGNIAAMAGILVQIRPGKGTMVAVNHRVVNTVINRCKLPADGDILVPAHTVAVMGTTDVNVSNADSYSVEPWEVRLMLSEGEKIIPGFSQFRLLRAWAGVRPLYQETVAGQNRDVTRAFVLLDHSERDQVDGLITITSGKWTTYRRMAEVTVDKACQKLNVSRTCRTHLETLPLPDNQSVYRFHHLNTRLREIEKAETNAQLICECELATRHEVEQAILVGNAITIDDIRRDVRLGMGPCQGGFCSYRAAGILHSLRHPPVLEINAALRDFLQERWKGMQPILWGQQLRQIRLNELIYLDVLNLDHLPGPLSTSLAAEPYAPLIATQSKEGNQISPPNQRNISCNDAVEEEPGSLRIPSQTPCEPKLDVLVIGAGLAGLVAGWQSSRQGKRTHVISKGWGATHWGSGCIDVLGYLPSSGDSPVVSPANSLSNLIEANPLHPYALVGVKEIDQLLSDFQKLCVQADYPLEGSIDHNWLLPTALGAIRPTCLIPRTMVAGDLHSRTPMLIVGFTKYNDFYPGLIADNLNAQHILARDLTLDLPALSRLHNVSTMTLARLFDTPKFRQEVVKAILPLLGSAERIGFPAVLGIHSALEAVHDLENQLGVPVFEIPGLPPSIPGIRLHAMLVKAIQALGGKVHTGMQVTSAEVQDGQVLSVSSEAAARNKNHLAQHYILATGGFLGGGFITNENGYAKESIFGLPLSTPTDRADWFLPDFSSPERHFIFKTGIPVSKHLFPTNPQGTPLLLNLSVVGNALGGFDPLHERSLEGVALVTGYWAAKTIEGGSL